MSTATPLSIHWATEDTIYIRDTEGNVVATCNADGKLSKEDFLMRARQFAAAPSLLSMVKRVLNAVDHDDLPTEHELLALIALAEGSISSAA